MRRVRRIIPRGLRRRLEVYLVDRGLKPRRAQGPAGVQQLGHRGYVTVVGDRFDEMGRNQLSFLVRHGLTPDDVLCDVGAGCLRGGRFLIDYLAPGNYLGLEGEGRLVELGIQHELGEGVYRDKRPEFVISYDFEFDRFSKAPTVAWAVSLFSHLNERDIRRCLSNLADRVEARCRFFASFFETDRPTPNFKASHSHLAFYYTRAEMERFGAESGWTAAYLGDWGSPSGQKMMTYSIGDAA